MSVVTIVGARGGAGSSTLALQLARSLRDKGLRIRLVDPDLWAIPDFDDFDLRDPEHTIVALCRHEESPWLVQADHILVIVPAEVRAIANAAHLLAQLERRALCSIVVRTPGPTRISAQKIENLLQAPLAAVVKCEEKIATLGEHGIGTTKAMKKSAERLITFLGLDA